jgi:hypothetical protein
MSLILRLLLKAFSSSEYSESKEPVAKSVETAAPKTEESSTPEKKGWFSYVWQTLVVEEEE